MIKTSPYRAYMDEKPIDWKQRAEDLDARLAEADLKLFRLAEWMVHGDTDVICSADGCIGPTVPGIDARVCSFHLWQAVAAYRDDLDNVPVILREFVKKTPMPSVTYYVRTHEHIKIGFTTNLKDRLVHLAIRPDSVLALEPGGREVETKRHRQFASLRVPHTELFAIDDALLAHIEQVRQTFGDPMALLQAVA